MRPSRVPPLGVTGNGELKFKAIHHGDVRSEESIFPYGPDATKYKYTEYTGNLLQEINSG